MVPRTPLRGSMPKNQSGSSVRSAARRTGIHVSDVCPRLLGGRTAFPAGIIPGVLEEILYAFDVSTRKSLLFIIGAGRDAAGLVARWLDHPPSTRPKELTVDHYLHEYQCISLALSTKNWANCLREPRKRADSA
jgi:hypothetical protein